MATASTSVISSGTGTYSVPMTNFRLL